MAKLFASAALNAYSDNRVCVLEFCASQDKNAISFQLAKDLAQLCSSQGDSQSPLESFLEENSVGLVLLKSSVPGIFVSGGNLKELATVDRNASEIFTSNMRLFCKTLRALPVPSVSLLSGAAYGGGTEIALATDFRWSASLDTALHFWQTKWGVPGGWDGMLRLQQIVPQWDARKVGIVFAAQSSIALDELLRWGIVDRSFESKEEDAMSATHLFAQSFLRTSKQLRADLLCRPEQETVRYDHEMFDKYWLRKEHLQKLSEFVKGSKS